VVGLLERLRPAGAPPWLLVAFGVGIPAHALSGAGLYWDVAWHVDIGRDEQLLSAPHVVILVGLLLQTLSAALGLFLAAREGRRLPRSLLAVTFSAGLALVGFPLDEVWHQANGIDVTLWSPTHLLMVAGGALAVVPLWLALGEAGIRADSSRPAWLLHLAAAATLLGGLSAFQAEYDFGVPQFNLVLHPVVVVLAGSLALSAARAVLGRGGALAAAAAFLAFRLLLGGALDALVGRTLPRVALYLTIALAVELAATLRRPGRDPVPFALLAGAAAGTIGLAGEWAWSSGAWHPWTAALLPGAIVLGLLAAIGGALLGAGLGGSLRAAPAAPPRPFVVAGLLLALTALVAPLPRESGVQPQAAVSFTPATAGHADVRVVVGPPDAPYGARWWEVLAWQGGAVRVIPLVAGEGSGVYVTEAPVPVEGDWKSALRLHKGSALLAADLRRPADPGQGEAPVEAVDRFVTLAPERLGGGGAEEAPGWLGLAVIAAVLALAVGWAVLTVRAARASREALTPPPPRTKPGGKRQRQRTSTRR
jgi:hypothetical protein